MSGLENSVSDLPSRPQDCSFVEKLRNKQQKPISYCRLSILKFSASHVRTMCLSPNIHKIPIHKISKKSLTNHNLPIHKSHGPIMSPPTSPAHLPWDLPGDLAEHPPPACYPWPRVGPRCPECSSHPSDLPMWHLETAGLRQGSAKEPKDQPRVRCQGRARVGSMEPMDRSPVDRSPMDRSLWSHSWLLD